VALSVANMPSHNHTATLHATSAAGNVESPDGAILATKSRNRQYSTGTPNVTMDTAAVTTANRGSGQAFGIRDPSLGIYHCIALVGIFPSRN
jgi:microcystin-dependent protein